MLEIRWNFLIWKLYKPDNSVNITVYRPLRIAKRFERPFVMPFDERVCVIDWGRMILSTLAWLLMREVAKKCTKTFALTFDSIPHIFEYKLMHIHIHANNHPPNQPINMYTDTHTHPFRPINLNGHNGMKCEMWNAKRKCWMRLNMVAFWAKQTY